jgi:putative GTP pyrophosphokinase
MTLSNSKITKLGERLRQRIIVEEDLSLLDMFRQTFNDLDQQVYPIIQNVLIKREGCTLTKRKRKTQQSIVDKLIRQPKLRLPQMQDIAGCRIVVEGNSKAIQQINELLIDAFSSSQWQIESKSRHKHGYRAIHIIVKSNMKFYEIQLRTYAQDIWANLVESLSDKNNTLKYGGSEQEEALMIKLTKLASEFQKIDDGTHEIKFSEYQQKIEEVIRNVLSN